MMDTMFDLPSSGAEVHRDADYAKKKMEKQRFWS